MEAIRKQFNELYFGTNGTGKTQNMLTTALTYFDSPANANKNFLCIMPDFSESKYDDIPEIRVSDLGGYFGIGEIMAADIRKGDHKSKSIYTEIYERYAEKQRRFNGLIINDDMGGMFGRRPEDINRMTTRKRQMNLDLMWNFHGLTTDCPKNFFKSVSGITLHQTEDDYKDTVDKIAPNKRAMFIETYFQVQAVTNGVMLDAKGNPTVDVNNAIYNKEKLLKPYFNLRVA